MSEPQLLDEATARNELQLFVVRCLGSRRATLPRDRVAPLAFAKGAHLAQRVFQSVGKAHGVRRGAIPAKLH